MGIQTKESLGAEARSREGEPIPQVPVAVLTAHALDTGTQMIHVLVKDCKGREQLRQRYLTQLGPTPVKFMQDAPVGGEVKVKTEKVVVGLKNHTLRSGT